ncbi:MAG TPA: NADH-quinone oxidoreductase subunit N [Bryobacterales bacterium]|jgi:NADH-quinone oxidoreductase subunit N|nr:NADH-quinone oxidoreductase subunit N [Bryobacterales bacterium]
MNFAFTQTDFFVLKPAILLCLFGCGILITDFFIDVRQKFFNAITALIGLGFTAYAVWQQQSFLRANGLAELTGLSGAVTVDGFGIFFDWIFLIATALAVIISTRYLEIEQEHHGEYYALLLFAQTGMVFLATGAELVTLFIGLELMALSFYVMVGFLRGDKRSNEAAMKYLLLGAFSSGLLAYGFSIFFGISGSTRLGDIARAIAGRDPRDPLVFLAMATTGVGLFFKIAAAPFHMWAPDAYEGAPTTVTAYLSVASKAASFAFLLRIFQVPLESMRATWEPLVAAVALLTMTLGNLAAISQTNIKRLLAYSSISHAGYILLGLVSGNQTGLKGIAVYILVYTFMNFGAFTIVVAMRNKNIIGDEIDDMSGLMFKHPTYAVLMLVFLLSLAGIPPTAGFLGKYYIFLSLIQTQHYYLAVFAALYVAVALYYYFRIVKVMFVSEEAAAPVELSDSLGVRLALGVTAAFTVLIGVYPEPFLQMAQRSLFAALR